MMTLDFYLANAPDTDGIAAAALVADQADHAMTGAVVMLADLAAQQDATGHALEAAVMRRASRWLQAKTETHREVRDELIERSGLGGELAAFLNERRTAAVATREASAPLFKLCSQYLRLALKRAALDEAEGLLASGKPAGTLAADAVLAFLAASKGGENG